MNDFDGDNNKTDNIRAKETEEWLNRPSEAYKRIDTKNVEVFLWHTSKYLFHACETL